MMINASASSSISLILSAWVKTTSGQYFFRASCKPCRHSPAGTGHPAPVTQFHFSFLRFIQRRSGRTTKQSAATRAIVCQLCASTRRLVPSNGGFRPPCSSISATIRRAITRLTSLFTKTRLLCPVLRRVFMFLSSSPSTTTAVAVYTLDFLAGDFLRHSAFQISILILNLRLRLVPLLPGPLDVEKSPIRTGFFPKRLLQTPAPSILRAAPQHTNSSSRHTARRCKPA